MKKSFAISLLIHTLFFILLALAAGQIPSCGNGNRGNKENSQNKGDKNTANDDKQIVEKSKKDAEPVEVKIVHEIPATKEPPKTKAKHADVECPSGMFYGGIGIYEQIMTDGTAFVSKAVPGYPGAEAGLEPLDIILAAPKDIKGEVGTEVTMTVKKFNGGNIVTLKIVRDKICLEGTP